MSQHRVFQESVMAMIGYDRPTASYFLNIQKDWESETPQELYSSIGQKKALVPDAFFSLMEEHGFSLSEHFKETLIYDGIMSIMNQVSIWEYDSNGTLTLQKQIRVG